MLSHTGCKAVIVGANLAPELDGMDTEIADLDQIIVRGDDYEDWLEGCPADDPMLPCDAEDTYIIRHSGGTTGLSKGVAYSHRSWLAAARDWFYAFPPVEPGDRCLHVGPISHGSGYLYVPMFLGGGCNVLLDHYDPHDTLDTMEGEQIAYMFAVPTMLNALVRDPSARDRDWSHLKVLQVAAAPIADGNALMGREVFGPVLYQLYGQTEVCRSWGWGPISGSPNSKALSPCEPLAWFCRSRR